MTKRGLGETQIGWEKTAKKKIIMCLKDGKWHRYSQLQKETGLSPATLTKHLKEMIKGIVERYLDVKSGQYPPPVSYRLKTAYTKQEKDWNDFIMGPIKRSNLADSKINRVHTSIEHLNVLTGLQVLGNLKNYFEDNKNETVFNQSLDLIVMAFYRDGVSILKEKLEEINSQGVNVQTLISEAEKKVNKHYEHLSKEK